MYLSWKVTTAGTLYHSKLRYEYRSQTRNKGLAKAIFNGTYLIDQTK